MAADIPEVAEYINSLDETLPPRNGARSNGDDYLRLIKGAVKRTFPNLTGPVDLTQSAINGLPARLNALEGQALMRPSPGASLDLAGAPVVNAAYPNGQVQTQVPTVRWVADHTKLLLQQIFPVGYVLFDASGNNPATWLGFGTWLPFAPGRVIVGVGTGTDVNGFPRTFTVGQTGGVYQHTLATSEMPNHAHNYRRTSGIGDNGFAGNVGNGQGAAVQVDTTSVGGGQPHVNVQPFIALFVWQRTA